MRTALPVQFQSRVIAVTTRTTPLTTTTTTTTTTPPTTETPLASSVEYDEEYDKPKPAVEVVPVTDNSEQLPVNAPQQATEFCPAVKSHNIDWPTTPKGATVYQGCPIKTKGESFPPCSVE